VTLVLIAGGVVWTQVVQAGGSERIAWQDVTARMGPVLWPKSVTRSFWKQQQLTRYLARTFPEGPPAAPRFDFTRRKLILVAAGPRSSTGYGVEVLSVREADGKITVRVRERSPTLDERVEARETHPYRLLSLPAGKDVYVDWVGR